MRWIRLPKDRARSDDGATIVEFALVVPILVLVTFAIMEFGVAFYEYLSVERAANDGARTAAFMGTRPEADCEAVGAVADSLPGSMWDRVDRIEVFRASPLTGDPIPGTTNRWEPGVGGVPGVCGGLINVAEPWPAGTRWAKAPTSPGGQALDIVGIRVVVDRSWITGFGPFSGAYEVNETSVLRIEPEVYDT